MTKASLLRQSPPKTLRHIMRHSHIRQIVHTDAGPRVIIEPLRFLPVRTEVGDGNARVVIP